jgi:hypothetical protein
MDSIGIEESRLLNAAINLSRAPNNQITNGLVNVVRVFLGPILNLITFYSWKFEKKISLNVKQVQFKVVEEELILKFMFHLT